VVEGPWEGANCIVEPSLKTSYEEGLYTARTLVQNQQEGVRIMNNIDRDQGLAEGTTLVCSQPVAQAAPVNSSQSETPRTGWLGEWLANSGIWHQTEPKYKRSPRVGELND
jgi:hypothetical protein